jgi:2-succinyl-5-enolpyruvyl-6-hydroxy-3-cyclohexene-1-carboxylate synthase
VVGLIGDLAACHDLSALLAARHGNATLILLNNGGGGIFGYLPQGGLDDFESFWLAPQGVDFAAAAQAFGVSYLGARTPDEFRPALQEALGRPGFTLLEVRIDRLESQERHLAYWQRLAAYRAGT